MLPLSDWQTLFTAHASAAATFTGLIFVAVSINQAKIISVRGLPSRAAESIQFLQVFFISTAALIPRQPIRALAIEILSMALFSWTTQVVWHFLYSKARTGHPRLWLISRIVQTQLATVPLVVAGVCLLSGWADGLYWLVAGFVLSFGAGVVNAWVLLVEIVR